MRTATSAPQRGVTHSALVGGVALALIAGFALAHLVNPVSPAADALTRATAPAATASTGSGHDHTGTSVGGIGGGLSISSAGYTLFPAPFVAGKLSFVIKGPNGQAVTEFADVHGKQLHLVVTRRDLIGYQHLHPTMAADGTWSVPADLGRPGVWRAFADFTLPRVAGAPLELTLGYDIMVPGDYRPMAIPAAARVWQGDGYDIMYEGMPTVGANSPLMFRVTGNAKLQPHLGSFGHLVMVREGDLAFVHIHPEPRLVGDAALFWLAAPSPGTYRMYFDHQVAGDVGTAEFTVTVG